LLFGVEELKNVFQLAVISATALDCPLVAGDVAAADGALGCAVDAWTSEADDPGVDEEELEPLEQADIAVTSTIPSAGARYTRRAVRLNRIVTRPFGSALLVE
jgi:hypothetical protein